MRCAICGKEIKDKFGNNPEGAAWLNENGTIEFGEFNDDDRCCDECNTRYVIPGRLYRLKHNK